MRTSTDAITWTARTSGFGTTIIFALTFGNGVYIAGGDVNILTTSTDAITWTTRTSGLSPTSSDILSLSYGGLVYFLGSGNGQLRTSTDAITWTSSVSGFALGGFQAAAYGNGVFVAAGTSGILTTFSYPTEGGLLAVRANSPTTTP